MYGIDLDDPALAARSWRWLSSRVRALLELPPVIAPDGRVIPATRLGLCLHPPAAPPER